MICELEYKVFEVTQKGFEGLALDLFQFQYQHNKLYRNYVNALHIEPRKVDCLHRIPFLPIQFFKNHSIKTTEFEPELVFQSSGTTDSSSLSNHYIKDVALYKKSFAKAFELFYGPVEEWCIIGLLPSYLERQNASLVFMVAELIKKTPYPESGFYLNEFEKLFNVLQQLEKRKQKTLLIGVTFALLDFAEKYPMSLKSTIVMETGGMKGRREEITRAEVHEILKAAWHIEAVQSEYGMTELLSQAYAKANGIFKSPPWMKVLLREEDDPFRVEDAPHSNTPILNGVINIIDLANIYSCAFIATEDVGRIHTDGSFEVLGRMDNSDIRGCSLMLPGI